MKKIYAVVALLSLGSVGTWASEPDFNIVGTRSVAVATQSTDVDQKRYNLFDTVKEARAAAKRTKKTLIVVRLANSADVAKYYAYAQRNKYVFHIADDEDDRFQTGMNTETYKEPAVVVPAAPPVQYYVPPQQFMPQPQFMPFGDGGSCGPGGCRR